MEFEWHPEKAKHNLREHGISFKEASTVFESELSTTVYDPAHSEYKDRFITVGWSNQQKLLLVFHTERGNRIRIISSRKLTKSERKNYE